MDNENKGFPNGWGDNSEDDDDYGFVDDTDEYDEDSAWGNSSSPFKKNEPVISPETNNKTNAQSESVTPNTNNEANDDTVHDASVQNVKQPESISSSAPTLNVSPNQGYILQKQKTSPILIIVIIVLVLVIGVLGGMFFMMSRKENNESAESNSVISDESENSEKSKETDTTEPPTESKAEETTVGNNAEENIKAPSNTKPSVNIPCSKSDLNSNYVNIINSVDFSNPNKGFIIDIDNDGINEMIIPDTTEMNYIMYYFDGSSIKSCSFGGFMGLDNFDLYKVDGGGNENYIYYRSGISYEMLQGYFSFKSGNELQIFIDYPEKNGSYSADWTIDFNRNENYAKGNEPVDTFYAQPADCHQKLMSALPHYGFNVYEDSSYVAINGLYKDEIINKLNNNDDVGKKPLEDTKPNLPSISNAELGRMYNAFYIESIVGGKGGGYIEDYNGDGTDDLICSVANAGYAVFYYKNGDLEFNVIPNTENYRYDEPLFGMKTQYYAWDELPDKCLEKAISCGFTANKDFYIGNTYQIGYVKTKDIDGTLNLRSAPSTDSDVLVQLPNGKLFNVIPSPTGNYGVYDDNGWYYISVNQNGNNYMGYISSDYAVAWDNGI